MRSLAPFAALVLLAPLATGCTYAMHEYQAAGYAATPTPGSPPRQATWVHARAEQSVILGITDNTDYVDHAYEDLLGQCPGEMVGLNTRYSTSLGFLSFRNVVEMRAMCLHDAPQAQREPQSPPSTTAPASVPASPPPPPVSPAPPPPSQDPES